MAAAPALDPLFAPGRPRYQALPWLENRTASGVYALPGRIPGPSAGAPVLATPRRRLAGWLIDAVVCALLGSAPWIAALRPQLHRIVVLAHQLSLPSFAGVVYRQVLIGSLESFALAGLASAAIAISYYWLATAACGSTIGKRIAGTTVVAQSTWRKPRPGASFYRALVFVLSPVLCGVFLLADAGWLLRDPYRQCLHDKAARTLVVRRSSRG